MRIALLAPPWIPIPPYGYGGIEWVVALLADQLVERGHDVTLFASGGSRTKAELVSVFEDAPAERMHENVPDALHAAAAFREIAVRAGTDRAFHVLHDHSACIALAAAPLMPIPIVHTLHGAFTDEMRRFYEAVAEGATYVAISEAQRAGMADLPVAAVVPNAVDVESYPFVQEKDEYLLCLGRITHDKGQDAAIGVARRCGMPLVLAGKIDPGEDRAYFDRRILPSVDGELVRFEGEVSDERKRELLAHARAVLFPIRWPEPFGLVMIEAAACGTPVVATRWGAVPEVVIDGRTGFVVEGEDAMVAAVERIAGGAINPGQCRADARERFSPAAMAARYEEIYTSAIRSWPTD